MPERLFVVHRTNPPDRPLSWPAARVTIIGMDSRDVTAAHARTIGHAIAPSLAYLGKLVERMRRRGFPSDDPLAVKAAFALEAVRQLRAALHEIEARESSPIGGAAQIVPGGDMPQWRKAMGGG